MRREHRVHVPGVCIFSAAERAEGHVHALWLPVAAGVLQLTPPPCAHLRPLVPAGHGVHSA